MPGFQMAESERSPCNDRGWWHGTTSLAVGLSSLLLQNVLGSSMHEAASGFGSVLSGGMPVLSHIREEIQERPMLSWETVVWWKLVLWEDFCWSVILWYSQKLDMKHWGMFWRRKNWKSSQLDCGFYLIFLSTYHWSILGKNVVHWEVT